MNKCSILKLSISILTLLIYFNTFSQIDAKMENVVYLNNSIPNCNPINFNLSNTHSISFNAKVEVDSYVDGPQYTYGDLIIAYWTGSAEVIINTIGVNSNDWAYDSLISKAYLNVPRNVTLFSSDFDQPNGGSIYIRYEEDFHGFIDQSCIYDITKPKFTINPNSTVVSCGNSSPKTFVVSNDNSSPGTLSYLWNVGSGWKRDGVPVSNFTTTEGIVNLTPYIYPPSNVKVTPILGSNHYNQLTSNVSLSEFNPNYTINGVNQVCSTATFSINNLPTGTTVTSWTVSNTNVATIAGNGSQAILTATGNGVVTVSAVLTNACGQTKTITKNNIIVGSPTFTGNISGPSSPLVGTYAFYSVPAATGAISYDWYFDVGNGVTGTNVDGWQIQSGQGTTGISVKVGNPGSTVVVCRATNSCGNKTKYIYVNPRTLSDPCDGMLKFSSNPMKLGGESNRIIYPPIDPCGNNPLVNKSMNNEVITVEIFNNYGEPVYKKTQNDKDFYVSELKTGLYIVKMQTEKGETITKKLIVE